MPKRPILKRGGKPLPLTANETKLLDDLWEAGLDVVVLESKLTEARDRRNKLIREARNRRFLLREIAELARVSQPGVIFFCKEDS